MLKLGLSLFGRGFKSSKCKTMAKLVTARIKLLRNKREVVVRQMRRDVALLLQSGQDVTARIRVEHVMREQNIMAANEIIELFCELVVARLSIIAKQRECPADLKEGISSLIFAAPRCSDIPELIQIRSIFEKKYGKEFVDAATELRPNCGVNRTLIEKLSVRTPTGEVKLKLMKEIAKEYQIAWDHTETEKELLKPPEELIEGPRAFVSATSMPIKPLSSQSGETNQPINSDRNINFGNSVLSLQSGESNLSMNRVQTMNFGNSASSSQSGETNQSINSDRVQTMNFENSASAAKVAAESAEKAIAAAQAAVYLANRETNQFSQTSSIHGISSSLANGKYELGNSKSLHYMSRETPVNSQDNVPHYGIPSRTTFESHSSNKSDSTSLFMSDDVTVNSQKSMRNDDSPKRACESQDRLHYPNQHGLDKPCSLVIQNSKQTQRRHSSYDAPPAYSGIKFDDSDGEDSECSEEIEMEAPPLPRESLPPVRSPPPLPPSDDKTANSYRRNSLPRIHPKLPDYVDLAARFEALKVPKY